MTIVGKRVRWTEMHRVRPDGGASVEKEFAYEGTIVDIGCTEGSWRMLVVLDDGRLCGAAAHGAQVFGADGAPYR